MMPGRGVNGIARIVFWFVLVLSAMALAGQQNKYYAPTLSCLDASKRLPPKFEVRRTRVLVSPDGRRRAYARVEESFDQTLGCRTKAQLFTSIGKSPFRDVYTETTSKTFDPLVSLGPIAWSPDSRWLAVERAAEVYESDFGGLDFLLYDSAAGAVSRPDVLGLIEKRLGKKCVLGYRSFAGFDAENRFIVGMADWADDNGRETHCIEGTAEWRYDAIAQDVSAVEHEQHRP